MMYSRQTLDVVLEGLRADAAGAGGALRRGGIDWQAAMRLANEHFVAPAFFASLLRAGRLHELPEDVRDYLALLHRQNAKRNGRLRQQAEEVIGAMNEAGIEPMLLKGGLALFLDHFCDPAARIIRDLDLLVPATAADETLATLRRLGYRPIARYPDGHHAYGEFGRAGDPGAVDLHFELVDTDDAMPAREVRQRAERVELPKVRFLAPSPTDRVLHALLHAQVHFRGNYYQGKIELRQLHDLVTLARRFDGRVEWSWMASRIAAHCLEGPLEAYLLVAALLLGLPWPLAKRPSLLARLQAHRCILQLRFPLLAIAALPVANLCAAFARHRMDRLYETRAPLALRRLQHAIRFVRRSGPGATMRRLFRAG